MRFLLMILTAEELFSGKNNAEYYFFELSALNIALIPPVIPENPFTIAKILKTGPNGINQKVYRKEYSPIIPTNMPESSFPNP